MTDARQMPAVDEASLLSLIKEGLLAAGVAPEEMAGLEMTTSLQDDLGVDSFQLTNVARHIEEAFALRFTLVDWVLAEADMEEKAYTVASLIQYIQSMLASEISPA